MKYIDILNSCQNKAKFQVVYFPKGSKILKTVTTPEFEMGLIRTIQIPDDANTIGLRIFYISSKGTANEIFNTSFPVAVTKCYEVYGAVDNPRSHEINCSNIKNQDYIYALNKSSEIIKGELIYTVGKEGFKEDTIKIKKGKGFTFRIPQQAELIQIKIFMIKEGIFTDTTKVIYIELIKGRPLRRCFEVTGIFEKSECKAVTCPNDNLGNPNPTIPQNCCCCECPFKNMCNK